MLTVVDKERANILIIILHQCLQKKRMKISHILKKDTSHIHWKNKKSPTKQ